MALIERLEAAEAGSGELDEEVEISTGYLPQPYLDSGGTYSSWRGNTDGPTRSLDAALALAERVLPGWTVNCHTADGSDETYPIRKDMVIFDDGLCEFRLSYCHPKIEHREIGVGFAHTPALALCIAILKAKEAEK